MKANISILFVSIYILAFSSCSNDESLIGFRSATVKFSSHETQHIALALLEDSTFYYISRYNEGMPWKLQSGQWTVSEGDVLLKGYDQFNLWLRPVKNQLELLDFEGNLVLSGKAVRLGKSTDPIWDQELSIVMNGKVVDIQGKKYFLPCNSIHFMPLHGEVSADQAFTGQVITVMLSFVPSELYGKPPTGFRIASVFGPAECK